MHPPNRPQVDHRLVQVASHPMRVAFLRLLSERKTLSPRQALQLLEAENDAPTGLSQVAYHVGVLEHEALVERAGEPNVDSGFPYQATLKGVEVMAAIGFSNKAPD